MSLSRPVRTSDIIFAIAMVGGLLYFVAHSNDPPTTPQVTTTAPQNFSDNSMNKCYSRMKAIEIVTGSSTPGGIMNYCRLNLDLFTDKPGGYK